MQFLVVIKSLRLAVYTTRIICLCHIENHSKQKNHLLSLFAIINSEVQPYSLEIAQIFAFFTSLFTQTQPQTLTQVVDAIKLGYDVQLVIIVNNFAIVPFIVVHLNCSNFFPSFSWQYLVN